MPSNSQQLNDDVQKQKKIIVSDDFDFDDEDVLIKDSHDEIKTLDHSLKGKQEPEKDKIVLPVVQKKSELVDTTKSDPFFFSKKDKDKKEKTVVQDNVVYSDISKKQNNIDKISKPYFETTDKKPIKIKKSANFVFDINNILNNKSDVGQKKDLPSSIKKDSPVIIKDQLVRHDDETVDGQTKNKDKNKGVFGFLKNIFNRNKKSVKDKADSVDDGKDEQEDKFYWLASDESDLAHVEKDVVEKKDILDKDSNTKKERDILSTKSILDVPEIINDNNALIFDKNDEKEISQIKKQTQSISSSNVLDLVKKLVLKINRVYNLKINLIERLKIIIDLYLRDVRPASETKALLQRSVSDGGMQFSVKQADQIMFIISKAYQKIHQASEKINTISKQTAQKAQIGVYSQEIKQSKKTSGTLEKENKIKRPLYKKNKIDVDKIKKTNPSFFKSLPKKKDEVKKIDQVIIPKDESSKNIISDFVKKETKINKPLSKEIPADIHKPKKTKPSFFKSLFEKKDKVKKIDQVVVFKDESDKNNLSEPLLEGKKEDKTKAVVLSKNKIKGSILSLESKIEEKNRPKVFRIQPDILIKDQKPKLQDIKVVHPHLVGPVEELSEMSLADFRRLGPTMEDIVNKIREKIALATNESFVNRLACIGAWRKSQPYMMYLDVGKRSLIQKISVAELINQDRHSKKLFLTQDEFESIGHLNKGFRY